MRNASFIRQMLAVSYGSKSGLTDRNFQNGLLGATKDGECVQAEGRTAFDQKLSPGPPLLPSAAQHQSIYRLVFTVRFT